MTNCLMPDEAHAVWDLLVELAGASTDPEDRCAFVEYMTLGLGYHEWRFGGSLGYGGKLHLERRGLRVSAYQEDHTPERLAIAAEVNARLGEMFSEAARP